MKKINAQNPSKNYEKISIFEVTSFEQIDQKIKQARNAFDIWSIKSLQDRIDVLQKLLFEFDHHQSEIIHLIALEVGMPISVCKEIDFLVGLSYLKGYLENVHNWLAPEVIYESEQEIHTMYFEPRGVVAASIAWNYPFTNFIWTVIPQLIIGNTIVIKHSEHCVLVTTLLEKIFQSIEDLMHTCQFVYGYGQDVGNYLINSDVDMLTFIGGVQTGKVIYQAAAQRGIPVVLELGGSAPGIVCEDADIDKAIESIFFYRFINSGQTCDGLKRLIVHESIFYPFLEKLLAYTKKHKVGPALDQEVKIGPLVNKKQLEVLRNQLDDALQKGANIVLQDILPQGLQGAYIMPTILTNISFDMQVWKEEVFGPILPVVPFRTVDEAITLANDTEYGLGGYIYTQNRELAFYISQALKVGNISINNANYVIPQDPFGGYKSSGIGRIHGKLGFRNLCLIKVVAMDK